MDKYEYRVKTEQMQTFVTQGDYRKAMEVADTIDWRRVKNADMLCAVSEIYENNGQFEKSRDILFIAYDRAPENRKIVYRLGILALKLGDTAEAMDCYEEFLIIAPKDPNQYILRYKILKVDGSSLAQQIEALERFKKIEYVERWAYELAVLYHQAGMTAECLTECDDLVLWFSDGKHVIEAMELKMKYKPLTRAQQDKYNQYLKKQGLAPMEPIPTQPTRVVKSETSKQEAVEHEVEEPELPRAEKIDVENESEPVVESASEDFGATTIIDNDQLQAIREATEPILEQEESLDKTMRIDVAAVEEELEKTAVESIVPTTKPRIAHEDGGITGQMRLEEILSGWEEKQNEMKIAIAAEKAKADAEIAAKAAEEARIREAEEAAKAEEEAALLAKQAEEEQEAPILPDDIRQLMEDIENGVEPQFAVNYAEKERREAEPVANKGAIVENLISLDEETYDEEYEYEDEEYEDEEYEYEDEEYEDEEYEYEDEEYEEEEYEYADEEYEDEEYEYADEEYEDEEYEYEEESFDTLPENDKLITADEVLENQTESKDKFEDELAASIEEAFSDNDKEAEQSDEIPSDEETIDEEWSDEEWSDDQESEEDAAFDEPSSFYEETPEEKFDVYDSSEEERLRFEQDVDAEEEMQVLAKEHVTPSRIEMAKAVATGRTAKLPTAEIARAVAAGGKIGQDTGFIVQARYDLDTQSEIGLRAGLTEEQKKLFSYFVPVRGMSEQLVDVLERDKHCTNRQGTSKTGNLLIIGRKGSGKTVLAVDVVKAIQKNRNINQGKVAIVTGEALNKKKISDIIGKLYGGALIIERANEMNEKTVIRLNKAMERETGELLVVLEDQRKPLDTLLASNMEFRKKFTSRLEVPIFINDELVTFGQTYAKENEYRIDEMGILALYSRIDAMQREDHAVTVAEVKDILDAAMEHSKKASVKGIAKRLFRKGDDNDGRIVLTEKNFH